jgi:hypothetical protein
MLDSSSKYVSGCREFRRARNLSRREAMRLGGLVGSGLTLPQLFAGRCRAAADRSSSFGRAKQVIMLYLHGGHPQQETFDPKPDGPSAVRGELGAIGTSIPGVHFCELLPKTAQGAHRLAVVRSMSHSNANHVTASLLRIRGMRIRSELPKPTFPHSVLCWMRFGPILRRFRRGSEWDR